MYDILFLHILCYFGMVFLSAEHFIMRTQLIKTKITNFKIPFRD